MCPDNGIFHVFEHEKVLIPLISGHVSGHLILDGQPGDVVEFAHNVTGMWIGTMKLRLRNGAAYLESSWVWGN